MMAHSLAASIFLEYNKTRKSFGRQPLFQVVPAHIVDSIYSNSVQQREYGLRNPVERAVQATLPQSEHECNTKVIKIKEKGINHEEGGWPREVNYDHEEHVQRHCRRVTHDDAYVNAVLGLAPTIKHCLDQNNAIEMYNSYFADMQPQLPVEKYTIKIANTFRDNLKRTVSDVKWTIEKNPKLIVSHYDSLSRQAKTCNIWDIHQECAPVHVLQPEDACWRLACSPVEPEVILCGLENGLVSIFDIRSGRNAMSSSSMYSSHRRPITGLLYITSRTHTEFFTGSPDGQCLWWDMRNLSNPIYDLPMSINLAPKESPSLANAEGVSALQFDKGLPTRFLCGTESGLVINVNRLGKTHSEVMASCYTAHDAGVRSIHRSPGVMRMFITCGDFTVRIWSEEVRTAPIVVHKPYRYEVSDVAWAPLRYSCYMSVCQGGVFYYWDLLRKYKEPVASLKVAECPLTKVTPHEEGEVVAVGDADGGVHLLHLSENMSMPGPRDKTLVSQLYERERNREHILDNRIKEIMLKKRTQNEAALLMSEQVEEEVVDEENPDQPTEDEYFRIVNKELESMVEQDDDI